MKEISPKVKFGIQFLGAFSLYFSCILLAEVLDIRKEFSERVGYFTDQIASEINKGIWGTRLALLEAERASSNKAEESNWHALGAQDIQELSAFSLKFIAQHYFNGKSQNTKLSLNSEELHLPFLPEIFVGYIVDLQAQDFAYKQPSSVFLKERLNLRLFRQKNLLAPNLVLIIGLSPHIDFYYILQKIREKALFGFIIFLGFSLLLFRRIIKVQEALKFERISLLDQTIKHDKLENSFKVNQEYQSDIYNYFIETCQSINELSNILKESKQKGSKIVFSPLHEVNFLENIDSLSSNKLQNRVGFKVEKINVKNLILEVWSLLYEEITVKSIRISIVIRDEAEIYNDKFRLKILLVNLITRSILNSPQGGTLIFSEDRDADQNLYLKLKDEAYEDSLDCNIEGKESIFIINSDQLSDLARILQISFYNNHKSSRGNDLLICLPITLKDPDEKIKCEWGNSNVFKLPY
ncbi:HAMP domain-containing histidine kinase [Candidatus Odyssella thessalonicensis]|uniref:HAMP domain-containing histidine kinase n=1 Tax=Candidatus Odyssella thessalonicensis TaxID=84647 RepID=UPI000225ACD8|nr:HAMP domain-containing histidine kinase [Candidatus Odyssella thessalonicensis]